MVDVEGIGSDITLAAAASGKYVAMTLEDGERSFYTPPVLVESSEGNRVGMWRSDVGEAQHYTDIKISITSFEPPQSKPAPEGQHLIRSGEDVAPPIPSPQDWILVLERETQTRQQP